MKKTKLLSLIATVGALSTVAGVTITSCSNKKTATKEQFLAKYEEFLANYKQEQTHGYTEAAFSNSDMFYDLLIDTIKVELTSTDVSVLKIYVRDGAEEPYQMNCAGMPATEISEHLSNFEKNCKNYNPITTYSVTDEQISMSIGITEKPEYGEELHYNACELVINKKGYITKYVNIPPKGEATPLGYEAILNLIYFPY